MSNSFINELFAQSPFNDGCLVFINSKSKGNVSLNYISFKEYNKMWTGHLYGTLFCCRNRLFSN